MSNSLLLAIIFLGICIVILVIYRYFKSHASLSSKDRERLFRVVLICGILSGMAVVANYYLSRDYKDLLGLALPFLVINLAFKARKSGKREEL